ncbi:MAG TPA: methyltransferase domain-containing protein [Thermoplasmata archaeon]|nr:methyltransferase domain-containing protein [Thermoplasmata archaeon]
MGDERGWEALADWYDRKQGDDGDLWHRAIIDPGLLAAVGPVRGLRLLDLGCGNGYLARRFARDGAAVTGVDGSPAIVAHARAREAAAPLGVRYLVADAAALAEIPDGSFDLVVSNMALMDIEDAEGALREAGRVLVTGGRCVASICHPCFDVGSRSLWEIERTMRRATTWRKVRGYRERFSERTPWVLDDGRELTTASFHRPLEWYARAFRAAGLWIDRLDEPVPLPEAVASSGQGPYMLDVPLHLVIGAVKAPRSGGTG